MVRWEMVALGCAGGLSYAVFVIYNETEMMGLLLMDSLPLGGMNKIQIYKFLT